MRLASLQFFGGVLAWGLMVPLLIFLMGPQLQTFLPPGSGGSWTATAAVCCRAVGPPSWVTNLKPNGDYLTARFNGKEDNLVLWTYKAI